MRILTIVFLLIVGMKLGVISFQKADGVLFVPTAQMKSEVIAVPDALVLNISIFPDIETGYNVIFPKIIRRISRVKLLRKTLHPP